MQLTLSRSPHPLKLVEEAGIPLDWPYLEHCWMPAVGPSVVALVRRVDELTAASDTALIDCADVSRMLGFKRGGADVPTRNNQIGRTLRRTDQFGLGSSDLAAGTFCLYEQVHPASQRQVDRLPAWSKQRHLECMEALKLRFEARGLPVRASFAQLSQHPDKLPLRIVASRTAAAGPDPWSRPLQHPPAYVTSAPQARLTARLDAAAAPAAATPPSISL